MIKSRFGSQVDIQTHYLNLDFAAKMSGSEFYGQAVAPYGRISGLADWFFRSIAFPDSRDNVNEYLARYYFDDQSETRAVVDFIRNRRQEMCEHLDELIHRYDLASSDIVGFSLCFFQSVASIAMANRLKAINPEVTIVFGGPAVKGVPGQTLIENMPAVDYVFSGAALVSFPALIASLLSGDHDSIAHIQGLFIAGADVDQPPEEVIGQKIGINTEIPLDYAPFLAKYAECIDDPEAPPFLLMQTSRGCWWADKQRCVFCGLNCRSEKFEAMSPASAIRHINSVLEYADQVSYFVACDNITAPNYFRDVFPKIKTPECVFIKYEIRPNITSEEMQVLCDAGIRCVQPGVEALSTESLKLMRKGVTAFSNILFLKNCLRGQLYAEWNILLFSLGESDEVYEKYIVDIPRLVHLQPPIDIFPVEFMRDSWYFEQAAEFGLELEPHESLAYIYPFKRETLEGLCFNFTDRNADKQRMDYWLQRLGALVSAWRERWCVEPDKRPSLTLWRDAYSAVISDSRSGRESSRRISDDEERLLKAIAYIPMTLRELADSCGFEKVAARELIASSMVSGLLFEEDGRYLSLCCD